MRVAMYKSCLFIIFFILLSSCKERPSTSSVKWGYLKDVKGHLVKKENNSDIKICGKQFESIKWAVETWAKPIERKFNISEQCSGKIDVKFYDSDSEYAKTNCSKWGFKGIIVSQWDRAPQTIVDCGKNINSNYKEVILHEVGHLFGLCDQYHSQIHRCVFTTEPVKGSVMHSARTLYLTDDDKKGIRELDKLRGPKKKK